MLRRGVLLTSLLATLGSTSLPLAGTAAADGKAAWAVTRHWNARRVYAHHRAHTRRKPAWSLRGRRRAHAGTHRNTGTVSAGLRHRRSRQALRAAAVARDRAAAIAAVLATPCQNTQLTPEPGNLGLVREAVLCLINRRRAQSGESPLGLSSQLQQAAEAHAGELVADDYFAHVSPQGTTPVDRAREAGYISNPAAGFVIGENLAWGTYNLATPAAIVAAWIASPGHLANILEAQYDETGIGVTAQVPPSLAAGAPGATYAQEFGVIVR